MASLLAQHNLALPAIAAHSSLLETDAEAHAKNMWRLKGGVDLAVELAQGDELPAVNTTPGGKPDDWDRNKEFLAERIGELVDYGASRGVTIAMEPHIGAIIDTPAKVLELLEIVNSPYLKVNFDISHFDIVGMPTEETVAALAPVSAHTHVKDQRGIAPDFEFLIPGEGTFDYVGYLKEMQAHGYDGFITAEVSFMVQAREDYDPLAAATLLLRNAGKCLYRSRNCARLTMGSPNILLLMTDQQRWDAMGCSGDWVQTPNLDRIASEGVQFTNCVTTSPASVSRQGLVSRQVCIRITPAFGII